MTLASRYFQLEFDPERLELEVKTENGSWVWSKAPYVTLTDGRTLSFTGAECVSCEYYKTGVADGITAEYVFACFRAYTSTWVNITNGDLMLDIRIEGDERGQIDEVCYPAAFAFNGAVNGYTVLPRMQGTLVPAGTIISIADGRIFERDGYMPVFGQVRNGGGYAAIYDTPYDAKYKFDGEDVQPVFDTSLGFMGYKRTMLYAFRSGLDYSGMAKIYREYLQYRGRLVTLAEKIARNSNVEKLIGAPIVHEGIAVHISEKSHYYEKDNPEVNDCYVTFDKRAEQLKALKARGVDRAYLHLDGWGNHGYDNLHPDPFPPHEAAGGTDGMRGLADTCRELGYVFGIHDQYRDYYSDAPSFDIKNAVENIDGSHPYCSIWYGGEHSCLCQALAPYYVARNYAEFDRLGIKIEGAYLDVYSVVGLDQCFSANHPLTREGSARKRCECFDILTAKGIIPSSEETIDCVLPSIALCHHSPFFTKDLGNPNSEAVGVPIPFFSLVYHDCVVIPWFGLRNRGGWGIPGNDRGFLYALLCGDTIYYSIDETEENIELGKTALELNKRVAKLEMVSHEFIGEGFRKQRSVFADGTAVTVDFDSDTYEIVKPF